MKQPLVSVIMPVYNTKQRVWEAIESILNQTFEDFEFIIIDDCSTDGSYEICKEYAKKDNRIKLHRNEKNIGISSTRNKLISLTTTDHIATQDSDDISTQNRLKLEYGFLSKHKEYWVVAWNNEIIDEQWQKIWYRKYSNDIKSIILKKSPVSNPTTMFKKSFFYAVWWYEEWINCVEDYDLRIRFYIANYKIKNLNECLLLYRIRKWAQKRHIKKIIKRTLKCQRKAYKYIKPSFSDVCYHIALFCLLLLPKSLIFHLFKFIELRDNMQ